MKNLLKTGFAALILSCFASSLSAVVIMGPGAMWEYSFDQGGTWHTGLAPFGNTSGGDFGANTYWPADGGDGVDLIVKKTIDLTGYDLTTIKWDLGVDNGFALFANGNSVASGNAEGFTYRWEYTGAFSAGQLVAGLNVIRVNLEDHGGATAFDMQIRGDLKPQGVPDSGHTLALLSLGLIALACRRVRR